MLNNIEAVLFDLDGTLVDSMWMWREIDEIYLKRFDLTLPNSLQAAIEGMSFTETATYFKNTFNLPQKVDQIKQDWYEMAYEKYANEVPLKDGAMNFLAELKERGIPAGIATSNGITLVDAVLDALDIRRYISTICTGCDVAKGKPAPDIYLKAAANLDVSSQHCLVFEDIPMGILAGKNAGMKVCAIEDDFSLDQRIRKRQLADYYIHSYQDISRESYEVLVNEK